MKKTNYTLFAIFILIIFNINVSGQDIHFSQIFETPLLRNPSLAGLFSGDSRFQCVYRSQWNSLTVPYKTTYISGELKRKIGEGDDFVTIGGEIVHDKSGSISLSTTKFLPSFNYHKSISEERNTYLSIGVMGGIVQRKFDRSKVTTNNQYDGTSYNSSLNDGENFSRTGFSYFDGSAGMSINTQISENPEDNFFIGLAYHHFNKPKKISFYDASQLGLAPKWVGSAGVKLNRNENEYLTIQSDYSIQGANRECMIGAIYSIKIQNEEESNCTLHAGSYIRWGDAIIPTAKLEFKSLSISGSYDANISGLKESTKGQGGFELSLSLIGFNKNNTSLDAVRCPSF